MVMSISTKSEFVKILNENKLVACNFTATWCGPCKKIGPVFEKLADQFKNVTFIKVDVDENSETAEEQGVSAMPTFKLFCSGEEAVEALVGASESQLHEKLAALNAM